MFSFLIMRENCPDSNFVVDFADKKSVNETFDDN